MPYLPKELINIILSFVERPQHSKMIKYIIEDCYEEDYDPYTGMIIFVLNIHLLNGIFYIEKIVFIKGLKIQNINIHP